MGTYKCNGTAACTVTLSAKGGITELSDGWIFTPDKGATSDVADDDYLQLRLLAEEDDVGKRRHTSTTRSRPSRLRSRIAIGDPRAT